MRRTGAPVPGRTAAEQREADGGQEGPNDALRKTPQSGKSMCLPAVS